MRIGVITIPKAVLYETIGGSTADELLSGWAVCIREERNGWLFVTTHYGYHGWMKQDDLAEFTRESLQRRNCLGRSSLICRPAVDLLEEPKVQSRILQTLFMGSIVTLGSQTEMELHGYLEVEAADGCIGYVPAISLIPREDQDCFENECRISPSFLSNQAAGIRNACQFRSCVLSYARTFLGVQYRWGGKTAEGIDCSGLAFMSYYMCGILIYRDAEIQKGYPVREIPVSQIQPADLLYFPGHVALYLGNGKYIHATANPRSFGCVINSLCPKDCDYRADLAERLTAAGTIFFSSSN